MKFINKLFVTLFVMVISIANAEPLNPNGLEAKQLEAMGYEVNKTENGSITIASLGTTRIFLDKNEERTVIFRSFSVNTKKNDQQRLELLETINKLNAEKAYQISLEDGLMNVALYMFGSYDAKTFAMTIRLLERANILFDNPKLLQLLK